MPVWLTAADLHRDAFFTHGALIIVQMVMGFLTTSVLQSGNHELMIRAGIAVNRGFPKP